MVEEALPVPGVLAEAGALCFVFLSVRGPPINSCLGGHGHVMTQGGREDQRMKTVFTSEATFSYIRNS